MKKVCLAFVIALIINAACLVVNYVSYQNTQHLKLARVMHGGEVSVEYGFGLSAVHTYGMMADQTTTHHLVFSWVGFMMSTLIISVMIYMVIQIVTIVRKT